MQSSSGVSFVAFVIWRFCMVTVFCGGMTSVATGGFCSSSVVSSMFVSCLFWEVRNSQFGFIFSCFASGL